jgi:D-xylose transport system substrate-binding protein
MRGTQSMTVYKPVSKLATLAAQISVTAAQGKLPQAETTIDNGFKQVPCFFEKIVAVDKDNMMETVVAAGFHPASQIQ